MRVLSLNELKQTPGAGNFILNIDIGGPDIYPYYPPYYPPQPPIITEYITTVCDYDYYGRYICTDYIDVVYDHYHY